MLARSNFIFLSFVAATLALAGGCALQQVKVPEDAQLIWYGRPPVNFDGIPTIKGVGQLYLYDDTRRKVVSVLTVSDQSRFRFGELDADHEYAMYFVPVHPAPVLNPPPATRPTH